MESEFSSLETTEQQSITSFPLWAYFKASYNFVSNTHPLILALVLEEDIVEDRKRKACTVQTANVLHETAILLHNIAQTS
jgi:hypothetical protein